jgi:hypothetical protein
MSNKRYAAKVDTNQDEIVKQLRQIPGVSVETGYNDVLIGCVMACKCGRRYKATKWREIKNPEYALSRKTGLILPSHIEDDQKRILDTFTGDYGIVSSLDEILIDLGISFPVLNVEPFQSNT